MIYKASLDSTAKLITSLAFIFFGIVIYMVADDLKQNLSDSEQVLKLSGVIASLVIITLFCLLFWTRGYKIENGELVIIRNIKNIKFSISDIESIEKLERNRLAGTIRTFGVGGLFGYFGKFYNTRIGKMTYYATKRWEGLLIKMTDGKLIRITPDEEDEFLKELEMARKFS